MKAIEVQGLTKHFGGVTALDGLDLTVEEGEIFGFLGPNGAGKSTTIDILLDYVKPTTGEVEVLGMIPRKESREIRRRTGVLPDGYGVLGKMTGREHVEFAIEARDGDEEPDQLLDRVGILDAADRKATNYSKGMAQRLMLAMTLAGKPDLLLLDEPTTGLDPAGAREIRHIVQEENERGATVFFSSHILEQVEAVCDRVGILNQGELVALDTIEGLRGASAGTGEIRLELEHSSDSLIREVEAIQGVSSVAVHDSTLVAGCENHAKAQIVKVCHNSDVEIRNIETSEASLEDIFVNYTESAKKEVKR